MPNSIIVTIITIRRPFVLLDTPPEVTKLLDKIMKIAQKYDLQDELGLVNRMLKKERVTLTELNQLKRTAYNMFKTYKKSNLAADTLAAKQINNYERALRSFIEDEAKLKGLPDIGILNQDTMKAREILDAMYSARATQWSKGKLTLGLMDGMFGLGTFTVTQNWLSTAGVVIGRRILESTLFKTTFAKYIDKLSPDKINLLRRVWRTKKHTKESKAILRRVTAQTGDDIRNQRIRQMENVPIESTAKMPETGLPIKESRLVGLKTVSGEDFFNAIKPMFDKFPDALTFRSIDDFEKMPYKILDETKMAGAAVTSDGEIVGVFNKSGIKGKGAEMVKNAIENGGKKLMALDGKLRNYYENLGFKVVKTEKNLIKGKPDVIFMEYAPNENVRIKGANNVDRGKSSRGRVISKRGNGINRRRTKEFRSAENVAKRLGVSINEGKVDRGGLAKFSKRDNTITISNDFDNAKKRLSNRISDEELATLTPSRVVRHELGHKIESQLNFEKLKEFDSLVKKIGAGKLSKLYKHTPTRSFNQISEHYSEALAESFARWIENKKSVPSKIDQFFEENVGRLFHKSNK